MPLQWIVNIATNHDVLVYALIIVLACAEGPILSMLFGVLIRLGFFPFWPVYIALMVGDLVGDAAWYWIGYKYGHRFIRRFGHRFGVTEANIERMTRFFHRYNLPILFVSKITNGLGLALVTLMTAGMVRIPFFKFMAVNFVGQMVWSGFLIGVGYFFSHAYIEINNLLGRISLIACGAGVLWLFNRFRKVLRAKADEMNI